MVLFIAFTMLFWLVPSTRVRFSSAAVGAIVTTSLFTLVRFGFGIYADHLFHGRFNLIYGALGLAIIFLIAIQILWVVILLGVEISFVYQNLYGLLRATEQQVQDEPRFDLYFALRALIEIARRFDRREEAPSSYRLAEQFGTTDSQMLRVLRKLEDAQLVKEIGGDWAGFVPGCDPDRITIEEVVGAGGRVEARHPRDSHGRQRADGDRRSLHEAQHVHEQRARSPHDRRARSRAVRRTAPSRAAMCQCSSSRLIFVVRAHQHRRGCPVAPATQTVTRLAAMRLTC